MIEIIYRLIEEKDQYFIEVGAKAGVGEKLALGPAALAPLAREKDQPILKIFQQQQRKVGGTPHRLALTGAAAAEWLRMAAMTGNLFFQEKKVVLDPFTKLQLIFSIEPADGEKLQVKGFLRGPTQTLPLSRCQAIFSGEPPCVVCGPLLQSLSQDIAPRFLQLAWSEPYLCTREDLAALLEEIKEEGEEAPEVVFTGNVQIEETREETRPFLKLLDRSGAFADLWIAYSRHGEVAAHDPEKNAWRRREEEKSWEKDLLETDYQAKIVDSSHYYCSMDKVVQSLTFLLEIGWKLIDYKGREIVRQSDASIDIGDKGTAFLFKGHVRYGEHRADVKDVVGAFNRRERFVELSPLQVGLLDAERNPLGDLGQDIIMDEEGVLLGKQKIGLGLDLLRNPAFTPREEITSLLGKLAGRDLSSQRMPPASSFQGSLHPYQQEGVNWLYSLYENGLGALLADEMGLGKTVQMIALLSLLSDKKPVLIVAPTSLLFHWRKELEKFLPEHSVYIHSGKERVATLDALKEKQVILTSYTLLRMDSALLQGLELAAVVLDEAQAIKNPFSQTAEAACQLQAPFRVAITGTPLENRHQDLWSIFHFLLPGLLGDRSAFQAKMCAAEADQRYLHRMRQLIRPFILRRRKELVAAQLPAKIEQVIWVEMEEGQRSHYEEKLRAYKQGFIKKMREETLTMHRMEVLEAILRLRQICCHPQLSDPALPYSAQDSAKLQKLLEDLEAIIAEGRKALIYSQFTSMLRIIEKEIMARGWGYVVLDGSTRDREGIVQKFQEDAATPLFLLSLKAGGVGLNLTAADYVLLYDPWWNDAVERQAIDRAHRLGRSGQVVARRYIAALTIEEKIMHLKEHKAALVEQLLEGEASAAGWNIEDLLALLD